MKKDFSLERAVSQFVPKNRKRRRAEVLAVLRSYNLDRNSAKMRCATELTDAEEAINKAYSQGRDRDAEVIYRVYKPAIDRLDEEREDARFKAAEQNVKPFGGGYWY